LLSDNSTTRFLYTLVRSIFLRRVIGTRFNSCYIPSSRSQLHVDTHRPASRFPEQWLTGTRRTSAPLAAERAEQEVTVLYWERGSEFLGYAIRLERDEDLAKDALQEARFPVCSGKDQIAARNECGLTHSLASVSRWRRLCARTCRSKPSHARSHARTRQSPGLFHESSLV
jgi:hypothetical protein